MALREFTDRAGRAWRAWDVTADELHPTSRTAEYLGPYLDGWLAFESADGTEKRRLHPIPERWKEATGADLLRWLQLARPVRGESRASRGSDKPSRGGGDNPSPASPA